MEITYGPTYINSIRFPTELQPGQPLNSYISGLDLEGLGPYRVLDRGGQVSFDTCDDSWSRRKNHPGKDLGNQPQELTSGKRQGRRKLLQGCDTTVYCSCLLLCNFLITQDDSGGIPRTFPEYFREWVNVPRSRQKYKHERLLENHANLMLQVVQTKAIRVWLPQGHLGLVFYTLRMLPFPTTPIIGRRGSGQTCIRNVPRSVGTGGSGGSLNRICQSLKLTTLHSPTIAPHLATITSTAPQLS